MAYLQLSNIEKYFGDHHAIKGIDLAIEKGEFVVFVGPSGCGKSTLLRLIAGLETIDRGSLQLDGRDITHLASSQRDLAMVFQSYALYPHMTVFENMSFALKLAGVDRGDYPDFCGGGLETGIYPAGPQPAGAIAVIRCPGVAGSGAWRRGPGGALRPRRS